MPVSIGTALMVSSAVSAAASIGSVLMADSPSIPKAEVPSVAAVAASGARQDTGAQVKLGVQDVKDARVSGARTSGVKSNTIDPLGGLGRGGLSV